MSDDLTKPGKSRVHFEIQKQGKQKSKQQSKQDRQKPKGTVSGTAVTYTVSKKSSTKNGKTKTDEYGTVTNEKFEDDVNSKTDSHLGFSVNPWDEKRRNTVSLMFPGFGFFDHNPFRGPGERLFGFPFAF